MEAAVLNVELTIVARKEGFRELANLAKMGLSFPTSSLGTTRSYIKRNENTVRKFVRVVSAPDVGSQAAELWPGSKISSQL